MASLDYQQAAGTNIDLENDDTDRWPPRAKCQASRHGLFSSLVDLLEAADHAGS